MRMMTTAFKIEKDVPIVAHIGRKKYPFSQLRIGQSFFVPTKTGTRQNVGNAAHSYASRHGWKMAIRAVKNPDGCRVWRTK